VSEAHVFVNEVQGMVVLVARLAVEGDDVPQAPNRQAPIRTASHFATGRE
jgi:hypothetical protein